jgi:DNA repair protein RecO (recombination protein O)
MRISLQPAFILHHRPYRETSLIIDLLTQDHGRIAAVARGARGARSRTRALLQPFVPLIVSWQGKSELMTLGSVEPHGVSLQAGGDSLLSALYINELLVRVLEKQDPHPKLYAVYHKTLLELHGIFKASALDATFKAETQGYFIEKTLRIFEKKLLEELGYGLQLQYDIATGEPFNRGQFYCYYPEQGFKLNEETSPHREDFIFSGKSLLALAAEELDDLSCLRDAKRLMRFAFYPILGSKPLNSRKLFVEVK